MDASDTGRLRIGPLAAAPVEIAVGAPGHGRVTLASHDLPDDPEFEVRLTPVRELDLRVEDGRGRLLEVSRIELADSSDTLHSIAAPGAMGLTLYDLPLKPLLATVELGGRRFEWNIPADVTRYVIALPAHVRLRPSLVGAPGADLRGVELESRDGEARFSLDPRCDEVGGWSVPAVDLLPGRWLVRVHGADAEDLLLEQEFELAAEPSAQELPLRLD